MRKLRNYILLLCIVIFAFGCSSRNPLKGGKSMFWKVSDENSSVYLLGSIHAATADFYPLESYIENAYNEADVIGFEIDLLNVNQMEIGQYIMKNAMYSDGTTLADHISPENYIKIENYFEKQGMPFDQFKMMKPGMIFLTLSQLKMAQANLAGEYGIDNHFLEKAHKDGKEIMEFEKVLDQMRLLLERPNDSAEKMLISFIDDEEDYVEKFKTLAKWWKKGDAINMGKEMSKGETPEDKAFIKSLLGDRDVEMTKKIEKLLKDDKKAFIILGCAHYVNETGIINKLAEKKLYNIIKY